MGLMQRRKGQRVEYIVRDHLRELKIYDDVFRVPLSGASEGYKSDVVGRKGGQEDTFEVKARAHDFDTIYALYKDNQDHNKLWSVLDTENKILVAVSTNFLNLQPELDYHFKTADFTGTKKKTFQKLLRLRKLLQGAKYLVLRGNNKPLLFIRYWD